MNVRGKAFVFGDRIDTDVLAPGPYMREPLAVLASHCLEAVDPDFAGQVRPGDIVVGGESFGIGSSREQAVQALAELGVGAIVAKSFARIFYRNALNNGLLAIVCPAAAQAILPGEQVEIDTERHVIRCAAGEFAFPPLSASVMGIVAAGGLVEYVKTRLATP